jgi:uncharacterized protein
MHPDQKVIDLLVRKIVEVANPLRIYLFGSAARGEMHGDSDIDLLVVMPEGTHRRRTAQLIYRRVKGIGVSFDVVVATPEDLRKHRDNIGLIYRSVLQDIREIYAA